MERLPDKITPDNLKDTVVEYRFLSDVPYEVLPGLVYQELKDSFSVLPRPSASAIWQLDPQRSIQFGGDEGVQFINDYVKIRLSDRVLVFNLLERYPGWTSYFDCIANVMRQLFEKGMVKSISRIGLRYISEYSGMSVLEVMKERPVLSLPQGEGQNITYRTEIRKEDYTIVLNVADRVTKQGVILHESFFSLIDIDVFKEFSHTLPDVETVLSVTDHLHKIEKEVFFGILREDYIQSLNPEYNK